MALRPCKLTPGLVAIKASLGNGVVANPQTKLLYEHEPISLKVKNDTL